MELFLTVGKNLELSLGNKGQSQDLLLYSNLFESLPKGTSHFCSGYALEGILERFRYNNTPIYQGLITKTIWKKK